MDEWYPVFDVDDSPAGRELSREVELEDGFVYRWKEALAELQECNQIVGEAFDRAAPPFENRYPNARIFRQPTEPLEAVDGDIWIDTSDWLSEREQRRLRPGELERAEAEANRTMGWNTPNLNELPAIEDETELQFQAAPRGGVFRRLFGRRER